MTDPRKDPATVKRDAIIAVVEVLAPIINPANKARVIEWAKDNFNLLDGVDHNGFPQVQS